MTPSDEVEKLVNRAVEFLREEIEVSGVVVFGSTVTGEMHESSDVDLAIFSPDVVGLGLRGRANLAARLRLGCGLELEPHFFPASALTDAQAGSLVKHILDTGRRVA